MTFEDIAEIGDAIRVYDFQPKAGRGDCYIEGAVVGKHRKVGRYDAIPFHCFEIKVTMDIWDGEPSPARVDKTVYVPYERTITEWDGRITKIVA